MKNNNAVKWLVTSFVSFVVVFLVALGVETVSPVMGQDDYSDENQSENDIFLGISFVDISYSDSFHSSEINSSFETELSIPDISKDFIDSESKDANLDNSSTNENSGDESENIYSGETSENSISQESQSDYSTVESSAEESSADVSEETSKEDASSKDEFDFPSDVTVLNNGESPFVYFQQDSQRWNNVAYGTDKIGSHGCGPVNMAMVISSLTGKVIYPDEAAKWSYTNGYWSKGAGTSHALMTAMAKAFNVPVTTINEGNWAAVIKALKEGKYVITRVKNGIFSKNNHFLTIRGITDDGKLLIANSISEEDSLKEWSLSTMKSQVNFGFWVYG